MKIQDAIGEMSQYLEKKVLTRPNGAQITVCRFTTHLGFKAPLDDRYRPFVVLDADALLAEDWVSKPGTK